MKIEIEVDDVRIHKAVLSAAQKALASDRYAGFSGFMAEELSLTIGSQVNDEISKLDFQPIIAEVIAMNLIPTVKELVQAELKAEAKKAVKAAMTERSA